MGEWAKKIFGHEHFEETGIIIAGQHPYEFEDEVLDYFDEVVSSQDAVYHAYLCTKNKKAYPIVFNVYGAAAVMDVLTHMQDGGCKNIILISYAYGGLKNLELGKVVIPEISYHFDGVYHSLKINKEKGEPDKELRKQIEKIFIDHVISYVNGINISVPALTFQLPHASKEYKKLRASTIELELAACFSRAKELGLRSVGLLVVSNNKRSNIEPETKQKITTDTKLRIIKTIIDNLEHIIVEPLNKKKFNIDKHLAKIMELPQEIKEK